MEGRGVTASRSHLLVVQVGEVDAVDFDNLVPCLEEKWRGISVSALSIDSLICRRGSPWGSRADAGVSSDCTSALLHERER